MTPPTVDRYRYPWRRVVPGMPHTIVVTQQTPLDLSEHTFEVLMLDAFTADPVAGVTYTIDMTDAADGTIIARADIPADIVATDALEIRYYRIDPDPELLIAGPVMFAPSTVPAVTP
jgi:hypothetical protein